MKQLWMWMIIILWICIFLLFSSAKDGFTNYSDQVQYNKLVPPFDEKYQTSTADTNPLFLAAKESSLLQVNQADKRPGLNCKDAKNCKPLENVQKSKNGKNVYNVNFKDASKTLPNMVNVNDNQPYQVMCSKFGTFAGDRSAPIIDAGSSSNTMDIYKSTYTLFSNETYNSSTQPVIQDCLYNEREAVRNICSTASVNFQTYKNNIKNQNVAIDINNGLKFGTIQDGKWGDFTADTSVDQLLNTLNLHWNKCNNANNEILGNSLNNCANINSVLDKKGYESCGLDKKQGELLNTCNKALTESNQLLQNNTLSEESKSVIQENASIIQRWIDYNPLPANDGFTKHKYGEIDTSMNDIIDKCNNIYNICGNDSSIITSSEYATKCHQQRINIMNSKCEIAIANANKENDTVNATAIENRLKKTIDGLVGKTVTANNLAIQNTISYCTNKSKMYSGPSSQYIEGQCPKETTVEATFEKPILAMQQNWSNTVRVKRNSLIERLKIIQTYISSYPNILKIDPKNIMFSPPGSGDNITIEQPTVNVTTNAAPIQQMYMVLESGTKGKPGIKGEIGQKGPPGFSGSSGNVGSTGVLVVPKQYYYTF
jgi:hypothetical protein